MSIICRKDYSLEIIGGPLVLTASKVGGSKQGTSITLTATSNPNLTGTCFFSQGNPFSDPGWVDLGSATFVAGVAVKVTSAMHAGTLPLMCYTVSLLFSNQVPMNVYTITLSSTPSNIIAGKNSGPGPFIYTSNVFAGTTPMTGSVNFTDTYGALGSAALVAGVATFTAGLQTMLALTTTAAYSNYDNGTATENMFIMPPLQVDGATVAAINAMVANDFTGVMVAPYISGWSEQVVNGGHTDVMFASVYFTWNTFSIFWGPGLSSTNIFMKVSATDPTGVYTYSSGSVAAIVPTVTISWA